MTKIHLSDCPECTVRGRSQECRCCEGPGVTLVGRGSKPQPTLWNRVRVRFGLRPLLPRRYDILMRCPFEHHDSRVCGYCWGRGYRESTTSLPDNLRRMTIEEVGEELDLRFRKPKRG